MDQLTIDEILKQQALRQPTKIAYRYLLDGESKEVSITYLELDEKAQRIAYTLQRQKKGENVLALLIYPSGLEFIGAFFGCLYAGVIAIPAAIPKKEYSLEHVKTILKSTQAMFILTDRTTFTKLKQSHFFTSLEEIIWVITDAELEEPYQNIQFEKRNLQRLAFLQYTSGSTSNPKGVMISHQNIIANQRMIKEAFAHDETTVVVGWLPLFHDMGLIGNILQPIFLGITSIFMSPIAFLQKPVRWLQAISRYHATTSGAPNFAYDLCVEKITIIEKEKLDLACWKVAFNGAEPIHAPTLKRFSKAFSSCGFNEKTFYPCYGLAETTVFSSGQPSQATPIFKIIKKKILEIEHKAVTTTEPIDSLTLVSVGKAWGNEKILIVDPYLQIVCKPCQVGEIWIQGQHVAQGYWNQLEVSKEIFQAFILGEEGFFLRTGDLGFWDEKENLFITGRLKDLMIIRGRNIYPQDVELTVERNSAVRPNGVAVFSIIQDEKEVVVIIAEIRREKIRLLDDKKLFSVICQAVSQDFQLSPADIVLVKPDTLPKTSSGKIQRNKCKTLFLEGGLNRIASSRDSCLSEQIKDLNLIEQELFLKIGEILQVSSSCITNNTSLNSYGIDSLGAIALQVFIETRWGISIEFEELIQGCSIRDIVDKILQNHPPEKEKEEIKPVVTSFPLSYQQLGIWLDTETTHNSYGYNLVKVIKVVSDLDKVALKRAISILIQRHELLRATFKQERELIQKIIPVIDLPFEEKHLKEKDLKCFLEREAIRLFSLEAGPLFHIWLLKTDSNNKFLVFSIHHLIVDLWSFGIFLNELFQVYESIIQSGVPIELPPILPYVDYISWQQNSLQREKTRKSLEYWKEKSQGDPFWLPSDKLRVDHRTFRGSHLTFEIPFELGQTIKKFARQENTTPFVIFLSAYFLLLYLYGGKKDLCIGTTTNGRGSSYYYSTFGMFANLVPLFLSLSPEWSFQFLVKQVKEVTLEGIGIYQLPFSYLLQHLQLPRDLNLSPLFQTLFVYQHVPTLTKELNALIIPNPQGNSIIQKGSLTLEPFVWNAPISTFDWTLFMNETKESFCGCFEYNQDLFCCETMVSLQTRFLCILENYLQGSTQIGSVDIEADNQNQEIERCLTHKTLLDLFASQVQRSPSQCSLVYKDESITFQALDRYSNQIARYLIRNLISPDSVVAVKMCHSVDVVATILAILKIGAAFLPLDPKTPVERLECIFQNSNCILCIVEQENEKLSINTLKIQEASEESSNPLPDFVSSDSIAYIIYTSGSTGNPKGICVSHLSLVNYLLAIQKHYSIFSSVHIPLYSSLAFDLTLTSLFFPLLFGHTLHIFSECEDVGVVLEKIFQHPQITHVKLTPAHLRLLETLKISSRSLTQLIIGGEQLTLLLASQIYKQFQQQITIVNEYGPTEATVGCIYFIYPSDSITTSAVPIGVPMQNTAAYNLSESLQPLPINVAGELYLTGANLAYGYWREPKLTAEKFLPNLYLKGKCMYKSGDFAKKYSSGTWLFLGRNDRQVKIRGYRIEIEEIETHLQNHPMVKDCIVLAQDNGEMLCAYYTTHMLQVTNSHILRDFLNQILPYYMIPSTFLLCKEIPLTPNGKVDVKALPSFQIDLLEELEYQAPYDLQQKQLVEIWSQVLMQTGNRIGINQSFFELGGDSIKAMQIVAKSRAIGVHFSVADLFKYPTIESLSAQSLKYCAVAEDLPCLEGEIDLSPMQHWFFHYFSDNPHHYNQVVHLNCKDGFDQTIVHDSFRKIVIHHEALRTLFPTEKKGVIIPFSEGLFTLNVFDYQSHKSWQQSIKKEIDLLQSSLNVHRGPLIRLALFHTLEDSHLFIIIHHLIIDGVSWRIILEDFDTVYQQMKLNKPVVLPAKTHSYKQWIALQDQSNERRSTKVFAISKQKEKSFILPVSNTLQLIQVVPKAYHTQINEIFLSALYLAFNQTLDLGQVFIHVEGHGRNQLDLTRTVGWFTTMLPTILEVENPQDIPCVIKTIKENLKKPLTKEKQKIPSISFNYLGQLNSAEYKSFTYTPILETLVDSRAMLPYNLQIILFIFDQRLHCHLFFNEETYSSDTQELFVKCYERKLLEIIQHCSCKSNPEFTPSDFGSYFTSLKDWDTLLVQVSQVDKKGVDAIAKIYPLLPLQQGLLYHSLQGSSAYIEQAILCLEGDLSVLHWQMGLQQLADAHESLRAAFFHDGLLVPHQIILKSRPLSFFYEDYRNNNFSMEEFLKKDREKGFDLFREPLIRFFLLRVDERKYYVIWSFNHIILDGWSLSLLFHSLLKNLFSLYKHESFYCDVSSSLHNYFDWYQSRDLLKASSYWKQLLGDYQSQAILPKRKIPNEEKTTKKISVSFPFQKIQKIQKIAKEQELTLSSLFQAIWALLLMHYTKQNDLVFGTVFSGRDPDVFDVEQIVGLLIVTLPLRVKIKPQEKLVDLAHFIQRQLLQSKQAQLPLSEIQAVSAFNQHLIDHLFVFENYPFAGQIENMVQNSGLPIKLISAELLEETHYNFLLSFLPTDIEITMEIQYNSALYNSSFMHAIPVHFEQVITAISSCPFILINEIELISEEAKDQIFHIFNKTKSPYFTEKTLPEIFQKQVQKNPDRIALIFENKQLSYQELDRRSTYLASFLIHQGVKPEQCIGIYMQPSFEMVIAWLAVLKTGCVYIPFDPSWSSDRILSINNEAKFMFILTSESLFPYLPSLSASVIQLDLEWSLIENVSQNAFFEIDPDQLAYVLYTSGSTGKPKGVAVTHRSICNHLSWIIQQFALGTKDRMLQLTSFGFDVSLCELYILFVGGTLVLAPSNANRDVNALLSIIENQRISFLQMVPSLLETLLEPGILNQLSSVRQVLCGADVLKKEHLEQWLKGCSIPLTNLYGLTETCIDATYYNSQTPYKGNSVPIGRPLSNVQAYILDCYLALLPADTQGELYISGLCLARGYYYRPDLTAERFLPHPFDPGKRIYRTLDSAFWQPDNYLKYLGRIDRQVKIRGFRIEVGEIETVLSLYPDIVQVLIKVIGQEPHCALCAYLTAKERLDPFLLHQFLEEKLPHYMVPTYYIQLAAFPLTPHGKIDNAALPHPQENAKHTYKSPQSELEKQLTILWKQVLKIDEDVKIGIDHNFFDLGGSSMTLMQLHYHLTQTFSYRISMEKFFQYPTIRKLAVFLSQKKETILNMEKLDQRAKKRQTVLTKKVKSINNEE